MFMKILLKFIAVDLNLISFTPQHLTATFQQVQGLIPRYLRYVQIFPCRIRSDKILLTLHIIFNTTLKSINKIK